MENSANRERLVLPHKEVTPYFWEIIAFNIYGEPKGEILQKGIILAPDKLSAQTAIATKMKGVNVNNKYFAISFCVYDTEIAEEKS